jgi:hypothetical protein
MRDGFFSSSLRIDGQTNSNTEKITFNGGALCLLGIEGGNDAKKIEGLNAKKSAVKESADIWQLLLGICIALQNDPLFFQDQKTSFCNILFVQKTYNVAKHRKTVIHYTTAEFAGLYDRPLIFVDRVSQNLSTGSGYNHAKQKTLRLFNAFVVCYMLPATVRFIASKAP